MENRELVRTVEFCQHGDERGQLVVAECGFDIPFEVKRIFYIYGSNSDTIRGQHANRKTQFLLVNVAGKCKVKICYSGGGVDVYSLERPYVGLYLPAMVWKEMYDFSPDSVLLVLASEHYDTEEYIRDYGKFMRETEKLLNPPSEINICKMPERK